jgi:hypothetical protein
VGLLDAVEQVVVHAGAIRFFLGGIEQQAGPGIAVARAVEDRAPNAVIVNGQPLLSAGFSGPRRGLVRLTLRRSARKRQISPEVV